MKRHTISFHGNTIEEAQSAFKQMIDELIAKPPALPVTRGPDVHFSGIATLARNAVRRFCNYLRRLASRMRGIGNRTVKADFDFDACAGRLIALPLNHGSPSRTGKGGLKF